MSELEKDLGIMIDISNARGNEIIKLNDEIRKLRYIIELKDVTIDKLKSENFLLSADDFNGEMY